MPWHEQETFENVNRRDTKDGDGDEGRSALADPGPETDMYRGNDERRASDQIPLTNRIMFE